MSDIEHRLKRSRDAAKNKALRAAEDLVLHLKSLPSEDRHWGAGEPHISTLHTVRDLTAEINQRTHEMNAYSNALGIVRS